MRSSSWRPRVVTASQTANPSRESRPQVANDACHEASSRASGTVICAAIAAPMAMPALKSVVTMPERVAKCSLMTPGSTVPMIAMPIPRTRVAP